MFVGIMPSVALFRHYLFPRITDAKALSDGVAFHFRMGLAEKYIEAEWKIKWDEWGQKWSYVSISIEHLSFRISAEPAAHNETWPDKDACDGDPAPTVERIKLLRERGLTMQMVAADFPQWHLAPLQARARPAWNYSGDGNDTHLW